MSVSFKALRQFNHPSRAQFAGLRVRADNCFSHYFSPHRHADKVALALLAANVISFKELVESFEFYARVRRRLRRPVIADLCAGHGLTGMLFGCFERSVERVILLDTTFPATSEVVLDAVSSVAPWLREKVTRLEMSVAGVVNPAALEIPENAGVVAVHACGKLTDRCLDVATSRRAPAAVMPCCYAKTARRAPRACQLALGARLATDVHRTYALEAQGYRVEWSAVPEVITPMNRILVATPPGLDRS